VHFCRDCGHEYHPVLMRKVDGRNEVHARGIDDVPVTKPDDEDTSDTETSESGDTFGFLTLHPGVEVFDDKEDQYPESWLDFDAQGQGKLKATYRRARAQALKVEATGATGTGHDAWFFPGKFRFCIRCGVVHAGAAKDRNRLASLSAEGRSSATTVLTNGVLRWMHGKGAGIDLNKRKLLGFTDNRQDAALQAGHFNDFIFVSLVRAGFLGALESAGEKGLTAAQLGDAQQKALGFDKPTPEMKREWLQDPGIKGLNLTQAEQTLREVLAYRVWFDQRRGWRYTNPNLEQLGLMTVEYQGLDALCADESEFKDAPPVLQQASPEVRRKAYAIVFDTLRQGMAVKSVVLEQTSVEQLRQRSHARLSPPWGFGLDESPRRSRWLMVEAPPRRRNTLGDEDLLVRGGARSGLGKKLKSNSLWGEQSGARNLKTKELNELIKSNKPLGDLLLNK
jgi:hypothetical protein